MKRSVLCVLAFLGLALRAFPAEFHVAPAGNDAGPGTEAKPLATLEGARDAIRSLKKAGPLHEPVMVRFKGGTYPLSREVRFGPEDSGTAACPITYSADGAASAVFDGSRRISESPTATAARGRTPP